MSGGIVAAAVTAGAGIYSANKAAKAGQGSGGESAVSPWFQSGGGSQASSMLQQLIGQGPQGVYQDRAFQESNEASMEAVQRRMSAQGQHLSGNEVLALNDSTNKNAMDFYNSQVNNLGQLAGVGFNPAQGMQVNNQWEQENDRARMQGIGAFVTAGAPALGQIYNWGKGLFDQPTPQPYNGVSSQVGSGGGGMSVAPSTGLASYGN